MRYKYYFISFTLFLNSYQINSQNSIRIPNQAKIHSINNVVSTLNQNAMGRNIEVQTDVTFNIACELVQSTPEIKITMNLSRFQMKNESMGRLIIFDSNNIDDKESEMGKLTNSIFENKYDIYLNDKMEKIEKQKIINSENEFLSSIISKFDHFGEELFLIIPDKNLVSNSWKDSVFTDNDNFKKCEYSILSINDEEAVLSFKGNSYEKKAKKYQGLDALVFGTTKYFGEMTIDKKSGLIKNKKTISDKKGTTEIMGQSLTFSNKETSTTKNEIF